MADIYDVQVALTNLASTAVYPFGIHNPSVGNCNVRIFPGWPLPATLDADLAAGNAQVSVFPSTIAKTTTRFQTTWQEVSQNSPSLFMSVVNNTITLSGTIALSQACMILVNRIGYSYGVLPNDTLETIASALAALIPNASASGAVITISGTFDSLIAKVIVSGTSIRELAREKRMIIVTVWSPTPQLRSTLAYAIEVLFAATYRVTLPDGYAGQLAFTGFMETDILEKQQCFRRDLHFLFEYAITQTETDYTVGENIINTTLSPIPI